MASYLRTKTQNWSGLVSEVIVDEERNYIPLDIFYTVYIYSGSFCFFIDFLIIKIGLKKDRSVWLQNLISNPTRLYSSN